MDFWRRQKGLYQPLLIARAPLSAHASSLFAHDTSRDRPPTAPCVESPMCACVDDAIRSAEGVKNLIRRLT